MSHYVGRVERGRKLLPDEEDATKLKFGEDFEDVVEVLFISEAYLIMDKTKSQQNNTNTDVYRKTWEYVRKFGKFNNEDAVKDLRTTLVKHNLHKYELAQLVNLCPEELDEAKSLVPSLARRFEDDEIRQMLEEIATLKKYQA
ncbi:5753_t:CDS:2 [Paraglomus occultum]|uniref:5753_t:CDS:1 n=1 Tax=Paraglomus occultum TaxID=144539 RepID=A0A9N9ASQ5_9GLOM|nr:5753_t:CDS:2 [Paraglomus occultum]